MNRSIPTPSISEVSIGPFTVHFYALCIITGIAIAIWLGNKRLAAHDESLRGVVSEVAVIAVPSGIIGGRLYHVITTPEDFFGADGELLAILKIWQGGLGIWGAISLGALGAFYSYRKLACTMNLPSFGIFLDAIAPGILFAQAIGRFGNWFNAELFGRPLDTWWGLSIPYKYRPSGYGLVETFHPTFLYEAIWCTLIAFILMGASKHWSAGCTFAAYVFSYSLGRFFIESIRIDPAHNLAGLRINQWVSMGLVMVSALVFYRLRARDKA
jgi:prolipoprotein diacylglyceryl transferase